MDGKLAGNLGEVLIRCAAAAGAEGRGAARLTGPAFLFPRSPRNAPSCNNVLYIRGVPEDEEDGVAETGGAAGDEEAKA